MKHCLVVDDSSVVRKVARRILEELNFTIAEAGDGREALQQCVAHMPDAILLDAAMPVMDGVEFLGELRQRDGGKQPKVIFCTTENDVGQIARARKAGADDYILKPFDRDLVRTKMQDAGLI